MIDIYDHFKTEKQMKNILYTLLLLPFLLMANPPEPKEINWISFEEAIAMNLKNPKPMLVDIYTDWCGWCKVMDKKTYTNPVIVSYINTHFYAVKFDAESKDPIEFQGKTFNYVPRGRKGVHELAMAMLKGKLSYPSTVFFDKEQEIIDAVPGYIKVPMMEKLIQYTHQEKYLTEDWQTFEKNFKSKL